MQASDLKLSIRGSAIVKPEVAENEDGSLQITYMVRATETRHQPEYLPPSTLCIAGHGSASVMPASHTAG